jgi:anti-sigma factor RsiW
VTTTDCEHPISAADIVDYWAGELEPPDEERIEDHVFTCAACAATLADGEALASGVRRLVRSGTFHALVSETVLNRLARDGARVRTYVLSPGDVVPCAVWDDDEVVVTRLRGDWSGVDIVSVVATLATGQELSRTEGIAVRPGQHELIDAISAAWLRQLPATTVRLRVTTTLKGEEQLLGEYTLAHAGTLSHASSESVHEQER